MHRVYLEETQTLKEQQWIWVLMILSAAGGLIPLIYGLYWQVGMGQPWGKEPMSDNGLIALFLFIVFTMALMFICAGITKLELKIDGQGVHYRFLPYRSKWSLISKQEIQSYEITKMRSFLGMRRVGYHRNIVENSRTMNLQGKNQLSLRLHNKRKINIGTINPEGIELAMRKLFNQND